MKTIKKLALTVCVVLCITLTLNAQESNEYAKKMADLVARLDQPNDKGLSGLSAEFTRLAQIPQSDWYAAYYAAYCRAIMAFNTVNEADRLCDEAEQYLKIAEDKKGDASEIACIRSMMATARMIVNPAERWMDMNTEIQNQLNLSLANNPNNPRAYFMRGQITMNTPVNFGGGFNNALADLKKAEELYNNEQASPAYAPHWGKKEVDKILSQKQ